MNRLIIFDFDDTLVDNSFVDYLAFKIPSQILGISYPNKKYLQILRKKGLLAKDIIQKNSTIDKSNLEKFIVLRKNFLNNKSINFLQAKPYLKLILKKLQKLEIEVVICTANDNPKNIIAFLKKNNLLSYFSKIYTIKKLKFKLDNDSSSNRILIKTSLLKLILTQNNYSKKDILYIGNSEEDFLVSDFLKINFIFFKNKYLPNPSILNMKKISNMKSIVSLIGVN